MIFTITENRLQASKLLLNVRKNGKIVMISNDYHDIVRLLLTVIIRRYRLLSKKISRLIGKPVNCPSLHC